MNTITMASGKRLRLRDPSPGNGGIERMSADRAVTVYITDEDVRSLLTHARNDHPVECCGAMVGRVIGSDIHVQRMTRGRNIARGDRRCSYQLDWQTLFGTIRQSRRSEEQVVGFYHSHPNGSDRPSDSDLALAWDGGLYLILRAPYEGVPAISAWRTVGGRAVRAGLSVQRTLADARTLKVEG